MVMQTAGEETPGRSGVGPAVLAALTALFILAGCVSRVVPPELAPRVNRTLAFGELLRDPEGHRGELVVFGGVILASANREAGTELEVLQKPLSRTDEPKDVDAAGGRFLARYPGYLETEVYAKERRITVLGEVVGAEKRPIGGLTYTYPVIRIRKIHLWPVIREYPYGDYPFWYDPWIYSPWWYGYPYPYPYRPYW